jgi:aminoglycoside phosphotransferase (APT) family kinase protein
MTDVSELSAASVLGYLRTRGVELPPDPEVHDLSGGGVSSVVLAVTGATGGVVVKRARPELAVADRWTAPRERTLAEGRALALAGRVARDWTPPLLDLDEATLTLTMGHAPRDWMTYKDVLLAGDPRPTVASRLGRCLAAWHAAARTHPAEAAAIDAPSAFEALRVTPYYRTAARRNRDVAPLIRRTCERMLETRVALVHGDLTPKNVLCGDGVWVIDFEVAHVGDPAFDVASLLTHLALKGLRRPPAAPGYRLAAESFLEAYRFSVPEDADLDPEHLFSQVGCLLLARIDGMAPVEYLDAAGREAARAIAKSLLREPAEDAAGLWSRLAGAAVTAP